MVAAASLRLIRLMGLDRQIAKLAREQHGVVSRRQLHEIDASNKMIRARVTRGLLEPLHPAAFLVGGAPPSWHSRLMAVQLWLGPPAFVSHRSAARLYELEGYQGTETLDVTMVGTGRVGLAGVRIHRSRTLLREHCRRLGPFAVVSPEALLLQLAGSASFRLLEAAFDSVLFKRLSTHDRVGAHLSKVRASGLNGVRALEGLLESRDPKEAPAESFFETDFYRFLRTSPYWDAKFQYEVFDAGGRIGRLDVAYPDAKIGLEAHSSRWHSSAERVRKDARRHNRLTAAGWRVLYETYDDLKNRPSDILDRLETLFRSTPAA